MIVILEKIFAVLIIMAVGFFVKKRGIVGDKGIPDLVSLVFSVTSPCMIFMAIATKEVSEDTIKYSFVVFGAAILYYAVVTFAAYSVSKRLVGSGDKSDIGVYTFVFSTLNGAFMGFPVTLAVFGSETLYYMVMHNMVLTVYLYTFGGFVIGLGSEGKKSLSPAAALKKLGNPNTIATALGFLCMLLKPDLPEIIAEPINTIGGATVPLSMLIVGMNLAGSSFSEILKKKSLVVMALLKMIAVPALGIGAAFLLPAPAEVKICVAFAISFPAAVASVPLVEIEGKDAGLASEGVALTTVISLVTLPVVAMVLTGLFLP